MSEFVLEDSSQFRRHLCEPRDWHADFSVVQRPYPVRRAGNVTKGLVRVKQDDDGFRDRKSTRLNSSHGYISYAVFCLEKKRHGVPAPCAAFLHHPSEHIVGVRTVEQ